MYTFGRRPGKLQVRYQRGRVLVWLAGFVAVLVLLLAAYIWFVLKWSYSTGERAGWVQKLSHKGWFCKTWEGELSMVSMPGATPEKFFFTVWSDEIAENINRNMGKRVSLHYEEKIGIPTTCFGETRHFVTKVTVVDEIPLAPGVVVPTTPAPAPGAQPPAAQAPPAPTPGAPVPAPPPPSSEPAGASSAAPAPSAPPAAQAPAAVPSPATSPAAPPESAAPAKAQ